MCSLARVICTAAAALLHHLTVVASCVRTTNPSRQASNHPCKRPRLTARFPVKQVRWLLYPSFHKAYQSPIPSVAVQRPCRHCDRGCYHPSARDASVSSSRGFSTNNGDSAVFDVHRKPRHNWWCSNSQEGLSSLCFRFLSVISFESWAAGPNLTVIWRGHHRSLCSE